jgi:hypothetical protein
LQGKLNLLGETKMMDYVIDVFKKVHPDGEVPAVDCYDLMLFYIPYLLKFNVDFRNSWRSGPR